MKYFVNLSSVLKAIFFAGIFMYGNHFDNINDKVECLLLPKLLSLNNPHFHYNQCNFSKRNMYSKWVGYLSLYDRRHFVEIVSVFIIIFLFAGIAETV